jgi:phosphoribosylaminoimidazole-succinocarboxamide synthase
MYHLISHNKRTFNFKDSFTIYDWERCKRLQASNFGRICKATERTNFSNLADALTVFKEIKTPAILHGQKYESIALEICHHVLHEYI